MPCRTRHPPTAAASAVPTVAPLSVGDLRIERSGDERWLVAPLSPEQLWPQLRTFWKERGFNIVVENAQAGVIETDWAENRAKLPQDVLRNTLGRLVDSMYSTGERDKFRMRVERTATGSEIYISHRGLQEVYVSVQQDQTMWTNRPTDRQLEAEFLSLLMVKLGAKPEEASRVVAAAPPAAPARARLIDGQPAALRVDESFDRAWRRVGQALDRSGFTVEDRDRSAGTYFVRYVSSDKAPKEERRLLQPPLQQGRRRRHRRHPVSHRAEGRRRRHHGVRARRPGRAGAHRSRPAHRRAARRRPEVTPRCPDHVGWSCVSAAWAAAAPATRR